MTEQPGRDPVLGGGAAALGLPRPGRRLEDQEKVEQHLSFCRSCCGELEFANQLRGFLATQERRGAPSARQGPARAVPDRSLGGLMARDLMFQQEIKETVQRAYAAITGGAGETVARRHTATRNSPRSPPGGPVGPGVGNPVRYARLQPGQTVLDVGSGGGIDTILAARRVGPQGRAIGLDVLEEMCERGRRHAAQAGVEGWTEFRQGEMEDILPDGSVDVAISNGVLNLSARKSRALAEIFRVLALGGRICGWLI